MKRYFKNSFYNPLETINDGPTIRAAVESSMEFFKKIAFSETYINEEIFSDAQLRVSRAIATVAIDNESYKFQKGDERIFMVAYSCALGFARRGTLTNYFAECFAFHIGSILVSSLSTHRRIMELKVDDDFTADFLHHMRRFANPTIKFMKKEGIDPVAINRECISTMFTYCFEGDDIFLMFDSIILELKGYRKYANFVVLAIFRQIENKGGRYETERVVPDQPLCAVDILDDVYAMQNTKEINFLKMFIDNACPCFNGLSFLFGTGKLF